MKKPAKKLVFGSPEWRKKYAPKGKTTKTAAAAKTKKAPAALEKRVAKLEKALAAR
jgi:hypothetical protein